MFSMWVNTSVVIGQVTVAAATLLGLALLGSSESSQKPSGALEQAALHKPLYGIIACSTEGEFLAIQSNGQVVQGFPFDSSGINELDTDQRMTRMAYCEQTRTLAMGGENGDLYLADARFPGLITRHFHIDSVYSSLAFSADGTILCAGDIHGRMHIWNFNTGRQQQFQLSVPPHSVLVQAIGTSHRVAVRSESDSISIWDLEKGIEVDKFSTELSQIVSYCPSADGKTIAIAGTSEFRRQLLMLETGTGKVLWNYPVEQLGNEVTLPICVSLSRDCHQVVLASGPYLQLMDSTSGKIIRSVTTPGSKTSSLSWIPGKNEFLCGGYHGRVTAWDATTLNCRWSTSSEQIVSAYVRE